MGRGPHVWFPQISAVIFSSVMVFILLTMLIAIISESFERAAATGASVKSRENMLFWLSKVGIPDHPVEAKMRIVVFKGEGLAVGDRNAGTSDPYVKLVLAGSPLTPARGPKLSGRQRRRRVHKSSVQESTLSPRWDEMVKFVRHKGDHSLVVSVYDEDLASRDEFLGQAIIPLDELPMDGKPVEATVYLHARTHCCRSGRKLPEAALQAMQQDTRARWKLDASSNMASLGDFSVEPTGLVRLGISCFGNFGQNDEGRHSSAGGMNSAASFTLGKPSKHASWVQ